MIKSLQISALRGATEPLTIIFEKNKKITIIYGENGTGKTTICDALEFLCNGVVGSLEDKGLGKKERFWHSTGKKPADLSVKLISTRGEWEGRLSRSKPLIVPDSPRPKVNILRRAQILKLITDQASKRYDTIKPFIDIGSVEQSEDTLRNLIKEEKKALNDATILLGASQTVLDQHWERTGKQGISALAWAKSEISRDTEEIKRESSHLLKIARSCSLLIEEENRLSEAEAFAAKTALDLQAASIHVQQEQSRISGDSKNLVEILQAAKRFFQQHPHTDHCPLCGSAEFAADLSSRIAEQLDSIHSLDRAIKAKQTAEQIALNAQKHVEQQLGKLLTSNQELAKPIRMEAAISGLTIPIEIKSTIYGFQDNHADSQARATLIHRVSELLALVQNTSAQLEQKTGFLASLKSAVENFEINYQIQHARENLIPKFEEALLIAEQTRRQFVDDILSEISKRVGELYEAIHPGEGLEKIRLLLDPVKRASLEIQSDFPGTDEAPPGAYFSESHLDTLGLCIWLAMAERDNPADKILVLDDVIGSVDEQHAERAIELLYQVSGKFHHCILTTHYRPWREKYRWGWLRDDQCHFVELTGWQHSHGILLGKCLPPVDELKSLLGSKHPSPQMICASAGVILEAILDFLTLQYECAVPRRKNKPTIGDLLPSINKKLRGSLRVECSVAAENGDIINYEQYHIGTLLDELQTMADLRNVLGCHFNELSQYFSTDDAVKFASAVHRLAELLIDPASGWPMSDKSGEYWTNSAKTVRLYPLKQPK